MPLTGRKVLIVEDDFLIAHDFAATLRAAGAEVIGPADSLSRAIRLTRDGGRPDCALLDIDLDGVTVFPLAEELRASGVPIIFLTGVGCDSIPEEFGDINCIAKPIGAPRVAQELIGLLGPKSSSA